MTKADIIEKMAKDADISKTAAGKALNSFIDNIVGSVKKAAPGADVRAGDVCRNQIRRALHATEFQPQRRGDRFHEKRLADARDAFQQHVAAREHGEENLPHDSLLPHHRACDLALQSLDVRTKGADLLLG